MDYENKLLIATVGLPRCGKSSWCRGMNYPTVCPDAIRMALYGQEFIGDAEDFVWAIAKTMLKSLFLAGHDIVLLDATNTTIERRDKWKSKRWTTKWKLFDPNDPRYSIITCLERAKNNTPLQEVIRKMYMSFQLLRSDELIFDYQGLTMIIKEKVKQQIDEIKKQFYSMYSTEKYESVAGHTLEDGTVVCLFWNNQRDRDIEVCLNKNGKLIPRRWKEGN